MAGQNNVAVQKLDGGADADRFLAPADVNTANDFPLAVKHLLNSCFGLPSELQIVEHSCKHLSARGGDLLLGFGGFGLSHSA